MKRALVLVLLVAACGGGADKGADAKKAYLAKAEALCADVNTKVAKARKEVPTDIPSVPAYVHRIVDLGRVNVDGLSKLTPPPKDAADLQAKVLGPLTEQVTIGDEYAAKVDAAAKAKDNKTLTDLIFHPPTQTRADISWMRTYGFSACATAADTGNSGK